MQDSPRQSPVREVRWIDRTAIVDAAGEINIYASPCFQDELMDVYERGPERIVVNLTDVPYMDSSGVASLVKLLTRVRRNGALVHLYGLNERVRGIFEITRLDSVFAIHDTQEEAMAADE